MVKIENKIETYWHGGDWFVDIVTTPDNYEAYLYSKGCCIKELMFGMPIKQQSYEEFIEIVEGNVNDHTEIYIKEYLSE